MHENTVYRIEAQRSRPKAQLPDMEDISKSYTAARMAIEIANRFFQFNFDKVRFSGEARYTDDVGRDFDREKLEVTLWSGEERVRQVVFQATGVTGVLDVDLDVPVEQAIRQDVLGALLQSLNKTRNLPLDLPREYSCAVQDWNVDFSACYFP